MDQADALYEIKAQRSEALPLFAKIAEDHPSHRLASQALYNAAFTALDLKKYDEGLKLAASFLERFKEDPLLPDVKYVAAECNLLQDKNAEAETVYRDLVENHSDHENLSHWQIRLAWALNLQNKHVSRYFHPPIKFA